MHSPELMIIFVHPDGWVHNFRMFGSAVFLTLLFAVFDGGVADDVAVAVVEVSAEFLEDAAVTEVDDAVTTATSLDGDGAAASSKTMTPPLLLPLPSVFIVAFAVSFNPFGMVLLCLFILEFVLVGWSWMECPHNSDKNGHTGTHTQASAACLCIFFVTWTGCSPICFCLMV